MSLNEQDFDLLQDSKQQQPPLLTKTSPSILALSHGGQRKQSKSRFSILNNNNNPNSNTYNNISFSHSNEDESETSYNQSQQNPPLENMPTNTKDQYDSLQQAFSSRPLSSTQNIPPPLGSSSSLLQVRGMNKPNAESASLSWKQFEDSFSQINDSRHRNSNGSNSGITLQPGTAGIGGPRNSFSKGASTSNNNLSGQQGQGSQFAPQPNRRSIFQAGSFADLEATFMKSNAGSEDHNPLWLLPDLNESKSQTVIPQSQNRPTSSRQIGSPSKSSQLQPQLSHRSIRSTTANSPNKSATSAAATTTTKPLSNSKSTQRDQQDSKKRPPQQTTQSNSTTKQPQTWKGKKENHVNEVSANMAYQLQLKQSKNLKDSLQAISSTEIDAAIKKLRMQTNSLKPPTKSLGNPSVINPSCIDEEVIVNNIRGIARELQNVGQFRTELNTERSQRIFKEQERKKKVRSGADDVFLKLHNHAREKDERQQEVIEEHTHYIHQLQNKSNVGKRSQRILHGEYTPIQKRAQQLTKEKQQRIEKAQLIQKSREKNSDISDPMLFQLSPEQYQPQHSLQHSDTESPKIISPLLYKHKPNQNNQSQTTIIVTPTKNNLVSSQSNRSFQQQSPNNNYNVQNDSNIQNNNKNNINNNRSNNKTKSPPKKINTMNLKNNYVGRESASSYLQPPKQLNSTEEQHPRKGSKQQQAEFLKRQQDKLEEFNKSIYEKQMEAQYEKESSSTFHPKINSKSAKIIAQNNWQPIDLRLQQMKDETYAKKLKKEKELQEKYVFSPLINKKSKEIVNAAKSPARYNTNHNTQYISTHYNNPLHYQNLSKSYSNFNSRDASPFTDRSISSRQDFTSKKILNRSNRSFHAKTNSSFFNPSSTSQSYQQPQQANHDHMRNPTHSSSFTQITPYHQYPQIIVQENNENKKAKTTHANHTSATPDKYSDLQEVEEERSEQNHPQNQKSPNRQQPPLKQKSRTMSQAANFDPKQSPFNSVTTPSFKQIPQFNQPTRQATRTLTDRPDRSANSSPYTSTNNIARIPLNENNKFLLNLIV